MSADKTRRGSIEIATYERSEKHFRLIACPFCGHEFDAFEQRWVHFLDEHGPEDAGLSPKGVRGDSGEPLFDDPAIEAGGQR
ncbi:hypothetical protein HSRCO_0215 [Halanaeroarchaeum sp. HSR-CO]|uniref:hypothetical protein n=1 Tax=Halanaeroarchaeum sp. HSR-CO TaxID=2866382 RepID=UPI00217E893B|nr:hypothetical protein [Halanaeroarchaeum sp. HSR-CO]UWG46517.1 hypothetical protein HSRCO_0215 [Halanaeroarchaeum sp. HSR-CO]